MCRSREPPQPPQQPCPHPLPRSGESAAPSPLGRAGLPLLPLRIPAWRASGLVHPRPSSGPAPASALARAMSTRCMHVGRFRRVPHGPDAPTRRGARRAIQCTGRLPSALPTRHAFNVSISVSISNKCGGHIGAQAETMSRSARTLKSQTTCAGRWKTRCKTTFPQPETDTR